MLRWLGWTLLALVALLATVAALAPAQWAAGALGAATGGRIELAEATGSLWDGQATVVLAPGLDVGVPGRRGASLPERLSWTLSPWALLVGTVELTLSHPSALDQPLALRISPGNPTVLGATTLRLPAALLIGLGAPWNTIRPGGVLAITWTRLQFERGRMLGDLSGDWQFASSTLTPVSPFGHYRLSAQGGYPGTQLQLQTISGPLQLLGSGTISEGGRLRFEGTARAAPATDPTISNQLTGLISLLGPRLDSETVALRLGS